MTAKLKDAPEGSFLVRDSQRGAYTLTVKKGGQNKLVRIINSNGLYGFSDPTQYRSVPDLIDHYRLMGIYQYMYMYMYHIVSLYICGFCEFMQSTMIVDYSTPCTRCTVYLLLLILFIIIGKCLYLNIIQGLMLSCFILYQDLLKLVHKLRSMNS